MKKTKIAFEDIKAGDLLEIVDVAYGVRTVYTGIAFEKKTLKSGFTEWMTAQGGLLLDDIMEYDAIYRIDVAEVKFEDIRKGDKVRVTNVQGGRTVVVEDVLDHLVGAKSNKVWVNEATQPIVTAQGHADVTRTIEILGRGE